MRKGKQLVPMAAKELQLLCYFVHHRDRVVPRKEILREVCGRFEPPCDNSRMVSHPEVIFEPDLAAYAVGWKDGRKQCWGHRGDKKKVFGDGPEPAD